MKKDPPTISFAVSEFLAELPLDGGERVLGSLALELTAALEKAPGYSKARLATSCVSWSGSCPQAEMERRREEATVEAIARKSAEHEAGVRRQKALLAELGVPDASRSDVEHPLRFEAADPAAKSCVRRPNHFALVPGHEGGSVERVVFNSERVIVAEKRQRKASSE